MRGMPSSDTYVTAATGGLTCALAVDPPRARVAGADQRHREAARREPAEELEQVHLGAAGERVGVVALVQDEEVRPYDGTGVAPGGHRHRRHILPRRSCSFSHQTIHSASALMRFDIFESPTVRSMKMIGISVIRMRLRHARYVISI